jgi:hypothetical protein
VSDEDNKAARIRALEAQLYTERASADRTAAELHRLRPRRELWTWASYEKQDQAMRALEEQLADLPRSSCIGHKCLTGHRLRVTDQLIRGFDRNNTIPERPERLP